MSPTESLSRSRLFLRLACTMLAAMAFIYCCNLLGDSVYSEWRMLAGPARWLLRMNVAIEDKLIDILVTGVLLPGIFAVGVWRNAVTVVLSVIAILCWIAIGVWIEVIASC